jgi:hypothetical protein
MFQSSAPGEQAVMTYEATLDPGESVCGSLHASGELTVFDTVLDFDSHFYDFFATPADMALQVVKKIALFIFKMIINGCDELMMTMCLYMYTMYVGQPHMANSISRVLLLKVQELDDSGNVLQCFIYGGYDFNAPNCGKAGKWPNDWHSTSDGTYNAAPNVTRAHFSGNLWSICIANGFERCVYVCMCVCVLIMSWLCTLVHCCSLFIRITPSARIINTPTLNTT